MSKDNKLQLAVTPSVKLRPSQAKLYEFILGKYKSGDTVTLPEVVELYSRFGCRYEIYGKPAYYAYDWKEHRQYLAPLDEDMLKSWALQWFVRNLGIFVVKGLLTAIPKMELTQLQIVEEAKS